MDFNRLVTQAQALANTLLAMVPLIVLGVLVLIFFYFASKGVSRLVRSVTVRSGRRRNLGIVLGRLVQWFGMFFGVLIALGIVFPSVNARTLIEVLGISSVAIGFAFRDILQNFLAGILILLTEPFKVDDQIIVGTFEGTVQDIQTRATTIRTYDGRDIVIPNATLFTESVIVNTAHDRRRLQYDVGIGYGDDIAQAKALMLDAIRRLDGVLADPAPEAIVVALAEGSVNIRVRWWITPPRKADVLEVQDRVLTAIKNILTANGIDLPFPTQQILFHDQTEEMDGDRTRQREGWPPRKGDSGSPRRIANPSLTNTPAPVRPERVGNPRA